jgi:endonuclease YncB( thermonuclease family)
MTTSFRSFVVLQGWAVVDGYQPDGDTVRFVPDELRAFESLERSHLASFGHDTSVCVRLEGIDAPELHYEGAQQPAAKPALDAMLRGIHWPSEPLVAMHEGNAGKGRTRSVPRGVRVVVLTKGCDSHGRAIGYVFADEVAKAKPSAAELVHVDALARCVNAQLVTSGVVYPLAYRSQPPAHRALFRSLAGKAREARAGVWGRDASRSGFVLRSAESLGPHGALVVPKLFRRSVTFFRAAARGMSFCTWLRDKSGADDEVSVGGGPLRRLSTWLRESGDRVRLGADVLEMVFAET